MIDPSLANELAQEYESFLGQLESAAIEAIATNDWSQLYDLIANFQTEVTIEALKTAIASRRANTEDLTRPGAGFAPTTTND